MQRTVCTVNGLSIAYARAGSGPPLVMLHGIGGNAQQFRNQLNGLADTFTVVAWDAPGYGGSDDPPDTWTISEYAGGAVGLMDALGFDRVQLLGQSWGGVIAQEVYRRHPERVGALILSDTLPGPGALPGDEAQKSRDARLKALETMTPAEIAEARTPLLLAPGAPEQVVREVAGVFAQIHPAGYRQAAIALSAVDHRDLLPNIRVPVLIICGAHDRIVEPRWSSFMRDQIPGARLVTIQNAGHMAAQEQPEEYNAALRVFLHDVEGRRAH